MLNYLFHFLTGYVIIKIEGSGKEEFINICTAEKIHIRNIKCHGSMYSSGEISPSVYHKLKLFAKDHGCKISVLKRGGLPFFLYRLKKRKVFCLGFFASVIALVWLCSRIWVIDIAETDPLKRTEISDILSNNGIVCGISARSIKPFDFQQDILRMYPEYTRFWLEKHGTKLTVDVRYAKIPPEVDSPYDICNITATKSGVIKKMVVRHGNPTVLENTFVYEGDLLVSGIITNSQGHPLFVKADADIFAEVNRSFSESAPLISVDRIKTGRISKKYCIEVFGKSFNLFFKEPDFTHYDGEITNKPLKFFGEYFLPLSLRTYKYCEVTPTPITRSASALETELKNNLLNTLKLSVPENNLISHEFVTTITDTEVIVTLNAIITENIAKETRINYESKPFVVSDITKKYITQE